MLIWPVRHLPTPTIYHLTTFSSTYLTNLIFHQQRLLRQVQPCAPASNKLIPMLRHQMVPHLLPLPLPLLAALDPLALDPLAPDLLVLDLLVLDLLALAPRLLTRALLLPALLPRELVVRNQRLDLRAQLMLRVPRGPLLPVLWVLLVLLLRWHFRFAWKDGEEKEDGRRGAGELCVEKGESKKGERERSGKINDIHFYAATWWKC